MNCVCVVMANVLASSVIDCGFEPWLGQTKNYKIGICCFSTEHTALRRKNKDWLAWNQDNVSERATCLSADCCFSDTIKIQLRVLVQYKADLIIISLKIKLFSPWYIINTYKEQNWCCLSSFDLQILITTPLVSSNSS